LADDVTDEVLEQRLFGRAAIAAGQRRRVEPDWADLARELKRPGVTMMVLWRNIGRLIGRAMAIAGSAICFVGSNGG
jgi:transposase